MSTEEKSSAADHFGAVIKKPKALLTKEDRALLSLVHQAEQANFVLANAAKALEDAQKRVEVAKKTKDEADARLIKAGGKK